MPWNNDIYYYTPFILKEIAYWYDTISEVLVIGDYQVVNRFSLAEFKADFDTALSSIGRTKWDTVTSPNFIDYRHYGKLQRVIIAEILGVTDCELESYGFYDIPQLRGTAYSRMAENLNRNSNE